MSKKKIKKVFIFKSILMKVIDVYKAIFQPMHQVVYPQLKGTSYLFLSFSWKDTMLNHNINDQEDDLSYLVVVSVLNTYFQKWPRKWHLYPYWSNIVVTLVLILEEWYNTFFCDGISYFFPKVLFCTNQLSLLIIIEGFQQLSGTLIFCNPLCNKWK